MPALKPIAVTPGEPSGIGPDIVLQLAAQKLPTAMVAIADPELLKQRARLINSSTEIRLYDPSIEQHHIGVLPVLPVRLACNVECGILNPANADYVLASLKKAVELCQSKHFHALVTGPINKACIIESGITFSGHTEFLGQLTNAEPVMMLASNTLRVVLVTTHLPLSSVSAAITPQRLRTVLQVLHQDLIRLFAIEQPRIAVTGLNPHAGEGGHLGREEIDVIEPVLNEFRKQGMQLHGPLPADTVFVPEQLEQYDAVLTMYHDQGLPVVKHTGFGQVVNITLGLPIIRTSVDHGTALELAGTGTAKAGSLHAAFELATRLRSNH